MAPYTYDTIMTKLSTSATAAAAQCSGGDNGRTCGMKWLQGPVWDGSFGVGQQMAALEVIQSNLIHQVAGPLTNQTGGTSQGNPDAGSRPASAILDLSPPTTADKVGAGILTAVVIMGVMSMFFWMST
jgi:mannan endo-1,6-alpha-mannosidase